MTIYLRNPEPHHLSPIAFVSVVIGMFLLFGGVIYPLTSQTGWFNPGDYQPTTAEQREWCHLTDQARFGENLASLMTTPRWTRSQHSAATLVEWRQSRTAPPDIEGDFAVLQRALRARLHRRTVSNHSMAIAAARRVDQKLRDC